VAVQVVVNVLNIISNMSEPIIPIKKIGEENWIEKLTDFLEEYDVEVKSLDFNSDIKLPKEISDYYENFGGIDSSDFMYNLYKPDKFVKLIESDWSFLKENFNDEELEKFIVFSESPSNDPVCLNLEDFSIHFFSHDPIKSLKIFENFNQYLRYEIIEIQKLMGDIEFSKEEEINFQKQNLNGIDIDFDFRYMKFC
jgi:hypothetical protein